jgi:hypothetical protein
MPLQPLAADRDRLLIIATAPVLLRELGKRDRRRVLLDPAAQRFDARIVIHTCGFYVGVQSHQQSDGGRWLRAGAADGPGALREGCGD